MRTPDRPVRKRRERDCACLSQFAIAVTDTANSHDGISLVLGAGSSCQESAAERRRGERSSEPLKNIAFSFFSAVLHPKRFLQMHGVGPHHLLSVLCLAASLAALLVFLLLGYLRYDQLLFTEWESRWQQRRVEGLSSLSRSQLEALALPVSEAPGEPFQPRSSSGTDASRSEDALVSLLSLGRPTGQQNRDRIRAGAAAPLHSSPSEHDAGDEGGAGARGGRVYESKPTPWPSSAGRKTNATSFLLSKRTYTEQQLLLMYGDMDIVYTFLNGSKKDHLLRLSDFAFCPRVKQQQPRPPLTPRTGSDRPEGGEREFAREEETVDGVSALTAEVKYHREMTLLLEETPLFCLRRLPLTGTTASAAGVAPAPGAEAAEEEPTITTEGLLQLGKALERVASVVHAVHASLVGPNDNNHTHRSALPPVEDLNDAQNRYVQLRVPVRPTGEVLAREDDLASHEDAACRWGRKRRSAVTVSLAARRATLQEVFQSLEPFFPSGSPSPLSARRGSKARHRLNVNDEVAQGGQLYDSQALAVALCEALPFLEELAVRAAAAATVEREKTDLSCTSPTSALSSTMSVAGSPSVASVLAHLDRRVGGNIDNRNRESDELKYSFRSLARHVTWHRGRVLLVSPGHVPDWLDPAKNFLASLCIDASVTASPEARRRPSSVADGGRTGSDDGWRRERGGGAAAERGRESLARERAFASFVRRQYALSERGGAEGQWPIVCFDSPAARARFARTLWERERRGTESEAPVGVEVNTFYLYNPTDRTVYRLCTDLAMERYALGVRRGFFDFLAKQNAGFDGGEAQQRQPPSTNSLNAHGDNGGQRGDRGARARDVMVLEEEETWLLRRRGRSMHHLWLARPANRKRYRPNLEEAVDDRTEDDLARRFFREANTAYPRGKTHSENRRGIHSDGSGPGEARAGGQPDAAESGVSSRAYIYFSRQRGCQGVHEHRVVLSDALYWKLKHLEENDESEGGSVASSSSHPSVAPSRGWGARASGNGIGGHCCRRLHVVHQDCLLPYGLHRTANSFTVEMSLYRLRSLSSIHLYVNDDYFFNRALPITKVVNAHGGVVVRGDNLLTTARRAPLRSADWRAGVDHTNLFLVDAVDGESGPKRRSSLLPSSLIKLWQEEERMVRTPGGQPHSRQTGVTTRASLRRPNLQGTFNLVQHMISAAAAGRSHGAESHARSRWCSWNETILALFRRPRRQQEATQRGIAVGSLIRADDSGGEVARSTAAVAAAASKHPWRAYLPDPLPETVLPLHHRRFSMHAPFAYCTNMFAYLNTRYEREISLHAYIHRKRAAADFHPPYLHNELVLKRPWAASEKYLPYLVQLERFKKSLAGAAALSRHLPRAPPPSVAYRSSAGTAGTPQAPMPRPVTIALDNADGCAPATLLAQSEGESLFVKFTDSLLENTWQIERVEKERPLFFNINTDFTFANVSLLMQTYLSFKFPFPIFLERGAIEAEGRVCEAGGGAGAASGEEERQGVPALGFASHESPFYGYVREVVRDYAQRRTRAAAAAASTRPWWPLWRGRNNRQNEACAGQGAGVRAQEADQTPVGVQFRPVNAKMLQAVFQQLMERVPLLLVADDEEALCPLVRSLRLALPEYNGRRLCLLLIPPVRPSPSTHFTNASGAGKADQAALPNELDAAVESVAPMASLAVLRARVRYPVHTFTQSLLCSSFVGDCASAPSPFSSLRLVNSTGANGGGSRERRGTPILPDTPAEGEARAVVRFHFPAGTPLSVAVNSVLTRIYRRGVRAPRAPLKSTNASFSEVESFLLQHTAAVPRQSRHRSWAARQHASPSTKVGGYGSEESRPTPAYGPVNADERSPSRQYGGRTEVSLIHAMLIDSRTGVLSAPLPVSSLASGSTARRAPRPEAQAKRWRRRVKNTAHKALAKALAVPGQLLSLEDFRFAELSAHLEEASEGAASGNAEGLAISEDYLGLLQRAVRAEGHSSGTEPLLSAGARRQHQVLVLRYHDAESTTDGVVGTVSGEDGNANTHTPAAAALSGSPSLPHLLASHQTLPRLHADPPVTRTHAGQPQPRERRRKTSGGESVHWITGASETDLLTSFPLPSLHWERGADAARLPFTVS